MAIWVVWWSEKSPEGAKMVSIMWKTRKIYEGYIICGIMSTNVTNCPYIVSKSQFLKHILG